MVYFFIVVYLLKLSVFVTVLDSIADNLSIVVAWQGC